MTKKIQTPNSRFSVALQLRRVFNVVIILVILCGVYIYARAGTSTRVEAATSSNLNFQARLLSASGSLVPDGTYNIQFNLYSVSSGGSTLWTETYLNNASQGVTVRNGYMSVQLGSLTSFPDLNWDQNLWLGMTVRGTGSCTFGSCTPADSEMSPRIKLTAVPYAFAAKSLVFNNGANTGLLQFGAITNDPIINLPNESGTVCLTSGNCLGDAGGGGASVELDNLTNVAINTSLLSGSATIDLGSGSNPFRDLYLGGTATNNFRFTGTATSAHTITIPDVTGTLCIEELGNCSGGATSSTLQDVYNNSSNPELTLDATRGALTIRDNPTPLGANLLEVQNNAGSTTYFAVDANGASVTGTLSATGAITFSGLTPDRLIATDASSNLVNTITAANLRSSVTGVTGNAGNLVFSTSPTISTPVIANIRGGTAASSTLTLRSTSGAGTSDAIILQTGSSQERLRIDTSGNVTINSLGAGLVQSTSGGLLSSGSVDRNSSTFFTGTLDAANGGTGLSSYTIGDLLYADSTSSLAKLADVALGSCLISGGVGAAPAWGSCSTGGGITGSGTTNQVAYFNGTGSITSSANFTFDGADVNVDSNTLFIQGTTDRVGIGVTTPAAKLHVAGGNVQIGESGDSAAREIIFGRNLTVASAIGGIINTVDNGVTTSKIVITRDYVGFPNSRVGIGNINPQTSLEVGANGAANEIITVRSQGNSGIDLLGDSDNDAGEGGTSYIRFGQDGGAAFAQLGSIQTAGQDSLGTAYAGTLANALLLGTTNISAVQLGTNDAVALTVLSTGNVGIGTTAPDAKLDVRNGAIVNSGSSSNYYRNVASYVGPVNTTGTMKITLPKSWSNTMMTVTIRGYDYTETTGAWEVVVGGYNYTGNPTPAWVRDSAEIRGTAPFNEVRLAHDGTNNVILLGDTSTVWSHTKVTITDFMAAQVAITGWGSGWTIAPITDETGITHIVAPTIHTYTSRDGNFGIGTTTPTNKLELGASTATTGGIGFGTDVALYRSAANILSLGTDDSFNLVSGSIQQAGTARLTSTGLFQAANGAVGGPAYSFSDDTNTGIYSGGSDILSFATAGVQRWSILANGTLQSNGAQTIQTSTGNLTISTAAGNGSINIDPHGSGDINLTTDSVAGSVLNITGLASGSGNALCLDGSNNVVTCSVGSGGVSTDGNALANQVAYFNSASNIVGSPNFTFDGADVNIDSNTLFVDGSANNVGIGTTMPGSKLDVNGDISLGTGAGTPTINFKGASSTNYIQKVGTNILGTDARFRTHIGTLAAPGWSFNTDADTGIYNPTGADTLSLVTAGADRLYINASGNVGIGTTAPLSKLDVASGNLTLSSPTAGDASAISSLIFHSSSGGASGNHASITGYRETAGTGALLFGTKLSGVLREVARFDSAGNLGIGTTTPSALLHVVGPNGSFLAQDTQANNTNKLGRWGVQSYNTSQSPFYGIVHQATTSTNELRLGGSTSLGQAATSISFYTASAVNTLTGTERWRINGTGVLESIGAQTIRTSTGNLSIATAAGNGSINIDPHGTGDINLTTDNAAGSYINITGLAASTGNALCLDGSSNVVTCTVGSGGVSGSGTANQVAYFDSASNITSSANFTFDGTDINMDNNTLFVQGSTDRVGIGTATPLRTLDVQSASPVVARFLSSSVTATTFDLENTNATGNSVYRAFNATTGWFFGTDGSDNKFKLQNGVNNVFSSSTALTVQTNGNVGIGTTNPDNRLTVMSGANLGGVTISNGGSHANTSLTLQTGATGIGDTYLYRLNVTNDLAGSGGNKFQILDDTTTRLTIDSSGNIGIGDITPAALLTVGNGDLFQVSGNDFRLRENGATPSFYGIFDVGDLSANRTYLFPNLTNSSDTVCFVLEGNCAGSGDGLTGSGTSGQVAYFNAADTLTSSANFTFNGADINMDANTLFVQGSTDRVGIGTTGPNTKLDVRTNTTDVYAATGFNWSAQPFDVAQFRNDNATGNFSSIYLGNTGPSGNASGRIALVNGSAGRSDFAFLLRSSNHTTSTDEKLRITHDGNVGIGTTAPDAKLDVRDGAIVNSGSSSNYYRNVANYAGPSSTTGTMKIAMPKSWSNTMMTATIRGYNYSAHGEWEVVVSGYNYAGTPGWLNYTAQIKGSAPFTEVRLAHDGTNNVILLGNTATVWSFPRMTVTDFMASYSNFTGWGSGWTIAPIVDETGITHIVAPPIRTYLSSAGNFGVGTTTPTNKLELGASTATTGGIGFGTDVSLYRSAANILSLGTGDSFNLVSGSIQQAGTARLTDTGLFQAANGAVGGPAYSFSDDTNTGIYSGGSDILNFATGGVLEWSILANGTLQSNGAQTIQTSTGNLSITTAAGNGSISIDPHGSGDINLVTASGSGSNLNIAGLASGSGSALCLDGSNNVVTCSVGSGGVSTDGNALANQVAYFNSASNIVGSPNFTFDGADVNIDNNTLFVQGGTDKVGVGTSTNLYGKFNVFDSGSSVSQIIGVAGDITTTTPTATLGFRTRWTVTDIGNSAEIVTGRDDVYGSASTRDANLQLWVEQNDTLVERLRITSAGNVGIGTTIPGFKFEVASSGTGNLIGITPGTGAIGDSGFISVNNRAQFGYDGTLSAVSITDNGANKPIVFTSGGSERLRIVANGHVGIGDTTPAALLSVGDGDLFQVSSSGNITSQASSGIGLNFNNTALTTDISLQNSETIDNDTDGTIRLTATNVNLTGSLQTSGTTRLDNSGNLTNIGNLTAAGAITIASTGAGNDIIINGADILDVQDNATFAGTISVAAAGGYYYGGSGSPLSVELNRAVPAAVNDYIEIGNFNVSAGAHNIRVAISVSDSSFSVAKTYILPIYYNATAAVWEVAVPYSDTGAYGANNFDMDVQVSAGVASLRLRRIGGATAGTAYIRVESVGKTSDVFTATTATGTASPVPTVTYGALYQNTNTGNVGIGTVSPGSYRLNVQGGDMNVSGSLATGSTTRITSSGLLQNVSHADAGNFFTGGTLTVNRGGTGIASYTVGDLIYASGATTLSKLAAVASGSCLISNGVGAAPVWGSCPGDGVGITGSGNTNQVAYFDGTDTLTSNANFTFDGADINMDSNTLFVQGSTNRIGIGTASPGSLLHLSTTGPAVLTIDADTDNVNENDNAQLVLKQDGGSVIGRLGFRTGLNNLELINQFNDSLVLGTNNTDAMTILGSGNVGIGDTTPAALLTVGNGDLFQINSTGNVTVAAASGTGLNFNNTSLVTDISLQNGETIDNEANGTIRLTAANVNVVGNLQTNSITRIDDSGNLTNIGNLTATGAITIASTGAGNNIILNSADTIELQDNTTITGITQINVAGSANTTIGNSAGGTITIGASTGSDLILNDSQWSVTSIGVATFANITCNNASCISSDEITNNTITGADIADDNLDFADFDDTLDLDAVLTLNQGTNTWVQNFTGTTTTGMTLNGNSLSSGTLLNLSINGTAAAGNTQKGLNVSIQGANTTSTQTTYGGYFSNIHTGTSSTNVALYATASGGTNNYAAIFESGRVGIGTTSPQQKLEVRGAGIGADIARIRVASTDNQAGIELLSDNTGAVVLYSPDGTDDFHIFAGTDNRFTILSGGNVGIGTVSPAGLFSVGPNSELQIDASGDITKIKNLTYSWPSSHASGVLTNNGSGTLTWSSAGAGDITAVGSMGSGDVFASSAASGQWLGLGASAGRIEFDDQTIDEINIMDARLGIGTATPGNKLHVVSDSSQTTGTFIGTMIEGTQTAANTDPITGIYAALKADGKFNNAGSLTFLAGVMGEAINTGAGTVGFTCGVCAGVTNSGSGTIAAAQGVLIQNNGGTGGGTINDSYGIYIDTPLNVANIVGNYAIGIEAGAGSVGIGTVSPNQRLEVMDSTNPQMRLSQLNSTQYVDFRADSASNLTITAPGAANNIFTLSNFLTLGGSSIANFNTAAALAMDSTTSLTLGDNATINGSDTANGNLTLQGTSDASRATSYLLLQPNGGHVGIGTATPEHDIQLTNDEVDTEISIKNTTAGGGEYLLGVAGTGSLVAPPGSFGIWDDTAVALRFTISPAGNLGVGDSSPSALLTVGNGDLFQVSATGLVLAQNGASGAGNLAYSFTNDTDTGFYRSAINELAFQTAGADVMTLEASGEVGIGTTNPTSPLHVSSSASDQLRLQGTTANSYTQMVFEGTGRNYSFGVGNASETTLGIANKFALYDQTLFTGGIRLVVDQAGNVGLGGVTDPDRILTIAAPNNSTSQINLRSNRAAIFSGNVIGGIDFFSNDTNLTAPGVQTADIRALASAAHTASVLDTDIVFRTTSGTTLSEAMRITAGGNVGIGDSTPTEAKLVVGGNLYVNSFASAGTAALCWDNAGGSLINDCSGTPVADYAEIYPTKDDVTYGEIVAVSDELVETSSSNIDINGNVTSDGPRLVAKLMKSTAKYEKGVIGVTSENYGDFSSVGHGTVKPEDNPKPVALSGRVIVKIAPDSAPILPGDYITTSASPGRGMKATERGQMIGKALEAWAPGTGKDTVMIFVTTSYADPNTEQLDIATLNVSGQSTLGALNVTGTATIQNLTVTGAATIADLTVTNSIQTASLTVTGDARIEGNLEVVGDLTVKGNLKIEGGITTAIGTATTDYTITGLDSIITADAAIEAFEATLPSAAGIAGRQYTIKKTDATSNLVKLMTVDDQTIDGAEHYDLATQYKYITVVSDGSNWIVIGQN